MIEQLNVRNMGGITEAALEFSGEFIVITGESGSGKSSLVRAFEFISGKRAQTAYIHAGSDETTVEALWLTPKMPEMSEMVTKRMLTRSGKGRAQIDGALATAATLAQVSVPLIEIQSQFAQLNLLDPARQLELVDLCGGDELRATKERLAALFPATVEAEREILGLKKKKSELETELEDAPARVRRIKALSLYPNCEREWTDELAQIDRQLQEAGKFEQILYRMRGGEAEVDLLEQLTALLRELYGVAPDAMRDRWTAMGETALTNLQDLFQSAKSELGIVPREELERRYEAVEGRVGALRKIKRETGLNSADELVAYIGEVDADMNWLRESNAILEEKNRAAQAMRTEVGALARHLRALRNAAAADFAAQVNRHLHDLAMEEATFTVSVNRLDKVRANGAESIAFMMAQKDLPPNPVSKAASGGELSRILIAIQASIAPSRLPGSIVFDEVEAGLGGRTALLAGEKLRELSRRCRTILITHEATIAAMASQHFLVRRAGDETEVFEISGEARTHEIARMLAGSQTPEALEHARSLLKRYANKEECD